MQLFLSLILLATLSLARSGRSYPNLPSEYPQGFIPFNQYADCSGQNITGPRCEIYIRQALQKYKEDGHYSSETIPMITTSKPIVRNDTKNGVQNYTIIGYEDKQLNISFFATFNAFVGISIPGSSMQMSIDLTFLWNDEYLKWNPTEISGIYNIFFNVPQTWVPDFLLLNTKASVDIPAFASPVSVTNSGAVTWTFGPVVVDFTCSLDASQFPFDTQICTADFASLKYNHPYVTYLVAPKEVAAFAYSDKSKSLQSGYTVSDGMVVRDAFYENSEWSITSLSVSNELQNFYGLTSVISYTVTAKRYSNYYMQTAIAPTIIVTIISILSLWVKDLQSRVVVATLSLLALVCISYTISSSIPISDNNSWLGNFTLFSYIIILVVCIETCVASYFWNKKQSIAPIWLKYLILLSLPVKFIAFCRGKPYDEESLEMSEMIDSENKLETPLVPTNRASTQLTDEELEKRRRILYSWKRASLSLDRISRFVILFSYCIGMIVYWSEQ